MGGQVGKSGNTGGNIITYDGLINENYFKTTPETTKTNSIEFSHCQTLNPFTKKKRNFFRLNSQIKIRWNRNKRTNRFKHRIRHFRFNGRSNRNK